MERREFGERKRGGKVLNHEIYEACPQQRWNSGERTESKNVRMV